MTDLHKAAQQALEALEGFAYHGKAAGWPETITNLRAALVQQQAGSWQDGVLEGHLRERERWLAQERAEPKGGGRLPPPLQAEPVEPVAWECKAGGLKPLTQRQYDAQTANIRRHYTRIAPPQRKPLTEEEIGRICDAHWSLRQLARAVERAHGIKE